MFRLRGHARRSEGRVLAVGWSLLQVVVTVALLAIVVGCLIRAVREHKHDMKDL